MTAIKEVINLSRNPKQSLYFNEVMWAINGKTENRFFAYVERFGAVKRLLRCLF